MTTPYFELKQKDIDEFKVLYENHCGIELTDEQAETLARHLIAFVAFVMIEK